MSGQWHNNGLCHCTDEELNALRMLDGIVDYALLTDEKIWLVEHPDGRSSVDLAAAWPKMKEIMALVPRACAEVMDARRKGRRDLERTALDRLGLTPGRRRWGRRTQGMRAQNYVVNSIQKAAGGRLGNAILWPSQGTLRRMTVAEFAEDP